MCIPLFSQGDGRAICRVPWVDRFLYLNCYFKLFCFDLWERNLFLREEQEDALLQNTSD